MGVYHEHEYLRLPVAIKESYRPPLVHSPCEFFGVNNCVSLVYNYRGYLTCLEKESSWFCWFWEPLLIRLRLDVSRQYCIAKCTSVILLSDGNIHTFVEQQKGELDENLYYIFFRHLLQGAKL